MLQAADAGLGNASSPLSNRQDLESLRRHFWDVGEGVSKEVEL